jgi:hypothetical protein
MFSAQLRTVACAIVSSIFSEGFVGTEISSKTATLKTSVGG